MPTADTNIDHAGKDTFGSPKQHRGPHGHTSTLITPLQPAFLLFSPSPFCGLFGQACVTSCCSSVVTVASSEASTRSQSRSARVGSLTITSVLDTLARPRTGLCIFHILTQETRSIADNVAARASRICHSLHCRPTQFYDRFFRAAVATVERCDSCFTTVRSSTNYVGIFY